MLTFFFLLTGLCTILCVLRCFKKFTVSFMNLAFNRLASVASFSYLFREASLFPFTRLYDECQIMHQQFICFFLIIFRSIPVWDTQYLFICSQMTQINLKAIVICSVMAPAVETTDNTPLQCEENCNLSRNDSGRFSRICCKDVI